MINLKNLLPAGSVVLVWLLTSAALAADSGLAIPRISDEPGLADFNGMAPATALARSMAKVEDFVQREPDDGEPATQRTEVYLGYDQTQLYAIFLAFELKHAIGFRAKQGGASCEVMDVLEAQTCVHGIVILTSSEICYVGPRVTTLVAVEAQIGVWVLQRQRCAAWEIYRFRLKAGVGFQITMAGGAI